MILNEELSYLIYSVVEEIPEGSVATYGQIAKLIGRPKNARLVGRALKQAGMYPEQRKAMGLAGRVKMEREFDRKIVVKAYLEEIQALEGNDE